MADTWAENNADAQDVPLDDQNLGNLEAGANRDNVIANEAKNDPNVNDETEEGARPKLLRLAMWMTILRTETWMAFQNPREEEAAQKRMMTLS